MSFNGQKLKFSHFWKLDIVDFFGHWTFLDISAHCALTTFVRPMSQSCFVYSHQCHHDFQVTCEFKLYFAKLTLLPCRRIPDVHLQLML